MEPSSTQASRAGSILVVEDEERQRKLLERHLVRAGFEVRGYGSAEEAFEALNSECFAALVTDLQLPGVDGLELIRRALAVDPQLPTIIITGHGSMESAVEALRVGAHDYILKPLFFEELARKLTKLLEHRQLERENVRLRAALRGQTVDEIVGVSPQADELRKWVRRAAGTDSTVMITGETGSGKEVIARSIHAHGPHADEPMLTINVAALPETMVESELFGYAKGAFTGAIKAREGLLRAAGKGTVFLDEIGEMSAAIQAKLLRALEHREVLPIGEDRPVPFEARILSATHRDLPQMVEAGEFRQDLYYRLNVIEVHSAPLREHPEDIAPLAHHLLERLCRRRGVLAPLLSFPAIQALVRYAWPGNVRELANVIERATIVADGDQIKPEHLLLHAGRAETSSSAAFKVAEGQSPSDSRRLKDAVDAFERHHIGMVLRECDGNRERAALSLGLSQATLYRRLEKLGLKGTRVPPSE